MEFYRLNTETLPSIHLVDNTVITPPYVHRKRKAGEHIMYVIKKGEMFLLEDGKPISLKAGDVCILDKDRTHMGVEATVCDYYYIHFMHHNIEVCEYEDEKEVLDILLKNRLSSLKSDMFSYDKCENNILYLPKIWHISSTGTWIKIEELLQKAKQENYNPMENYKVMCACYIQMVFMEIERGFLDEQKEMIAPNLPKYYEKVNQILEWLNSHYEEEITSPILEEAFERNFDYMNRIFKKVTGQTIFHYLTQIRINHAKILILHSSMKMSEIGKKVGFSDEYYFNRTFKKHVGVPPATYARTYQIFEK